MREVSLKSYNRILDQVHILANSFQFIPSSPSNVFLMTLAKMTPIHLMSPVVLLKCGN